MPDRLQNYISYKLSGLWYARYNRNGTWEEGGIDRSNIGGCETGGTSSWPPKQREDRIL